MLKLLLQLLAMIALFFLTWFGLSRPDWMHIFHVEEAGLKTEEKLGNLYWEIISKLEKEYNDPSLINRVDSILIRICEANDINRDEIKLHLVDKDEINAFAMPDHHLVLYRGLINDCENAEELCGVLAHEIAHMEKGHIMRKLTREIGLSILISMTTGNGNPEIIQRAIKVLSSSAYDRNLEREADITGTEYLINAEIDPEPFATFLFRLSAKEEGLPEQIFWVSSHPGSEERATDIIEYVKNKKFETILVMDSLQWIDFKAAFNPVF